MDVVGCFGVQLDLVGFVLLFDLLPLEISIDYVCVVELWLCWFDLGLIC